jgi:ectoine hydroxylase-related dioxygenase (phytanoyl-CoA dioxygenase family)
MKLKQLKPLHWLYNLLHYKELKHNRAAFRRYHIKKSLIASVSSRDFPDKESRAWLDVGNSMELAPLKAGFSHFDPLVQEQLRNWSERGYMILHNVFSEDAVVAIDAEVDRIYRQGKVELTHDNKLPFLNKLSPVIERATHNAELVRVLEFILDREVVPFQTLNFIKGSGQRAHSDSIHMTTYPLGYLIAAWVALEDILPDGGPLFYYPGSHRLPYLLNDEFENYSSKLSLGNKKYRDYEDMTAHIIESQRLQPQLFLPQKGDVLIWHANLIHGGMPVKDQDLTRKSMVIHYYAKDVIKYHEITERPALMQ